MTQSRADPALVLESLRSSAHDGISISNFSPVIDSPGLGAVGSLKSSKDFSKMFVKWVLCLALYVHSLGIANASPATQHVLSQGTFTRVRHELRKAEIVPTVINDFTPSLFVNISWANAEANLGNTISPKYLQDAPSVAIFDENPSSRMAHSKLTYILTLTDPDAPSRDNPEWAEMCHWVTAGLSMESAQSTQASSLKGDLDEIMPYKPPGPPKKTGKHRYVFIIFVPANGTTEKLNLSKPSDRQHWGTGKERHGVRDWADKNGLTAVGANFIYSQNKKQ